MRKKVHFGRTMHCLPQMLKSTFFEKKFKWSGPEGGYGMKKKQNTLILAIEVIVDTFVFALVILLVFHFYPIVPCTHIY